MTAGREASPMEQEYPTICAWVRHQTVSAPALHSELTKALRWLDGEDVEPGSTDAMSVTFASKVVTGRCREHALTYCEECGHV